MHEEREADPRDDLDAGREKTDEADSSEKAKEEFEDDPSRNPEDDSLKGIKGG